MYVPQPRQSYNNNYQQSYAVTNSGSPGTNSTNTYTRISIYEPNQTGAAYTPYTSSPRDVYYGSSSTTTFNNNPNSLRSSSPLRANAPLTSSYAVSSANYGYSPSNNVTGDPLMSAVLASTVTGQTRVQPVNSRQPFYTSASPGIPTTVSALEPQPDQIRTSSYSNRSNSPGAVNYSQYAGRDLTTDGIMLPSGDMYYVRRSQVGTPVGSQGASPRLRSTNYYSKDYEYSPPRDYYTNPLTPGEVGYTADTVAASRAPVQAINFEYNAIPNSVYTDTYYNPSGQLVTNQTRTTTTSSPTASTPYYTQQDYNYNAAPYTTTVTNTTNPQGVFQRGRSPSPSSRQYEYNTAYDPNTYNYSPNYSYTAAATTTNAPYASYPSNSPRPLSPTTAATLAAAYPSYTTYPNNYNTATIGDRTRTPSPARDDPYYSYYNRYNTDYYQFQPNQAYPTLAPTSQIDYFGGVIPSRSPSPATREQLYLAYPPAAATSSSNYNPQNVRSPSTSSNIRDPNPNSFTGANQPQRGRTMTPGRNVGDYYAYDDYPGYSYYDGRTFSPSGKIYSPSGRTYSPSGRIYAPKNPYGDSLVPLPTAQAYQVRKPTSSPERLTSLAPYSPTPAQFLGDEERRRFKEDEDNNEREYWKRRVQDLENAQRTKADKNKDRATILRVLQLEVDRLKGIVDKLEPNVNNLKNDNKALRDENDRLARDNNIRKLGSLAPPPEKPARAPANAAPNAGPGPAPGGGPATGPGLNSEAADRNN